jgi:predicted DCC family thiol-disulfide oxidoreductase YuxK
VVVYSVRGDVAALWWMLEIRVVLFDAECVLCSTNAQFILTQDRRETFRLASIQTEAGADLCRRHGLNPADPTSILLIEGERVRKDSDAVLGIYEALGFPWRLVGLFRVIPALFRDPVYRWVAKNRYRLFGRRQTCWVPSPAYRSRIL